MPRRKNLFLTLSLFAVICAIFTACKHNTRNSKTPSQLFAEIRLNVSGAKTIGGGSGTNADGSGINASVKRAILADDTPLVKFLNDGTCSSIFENFPEYNNLSFCVVEDLVVSPDESLYIIWKEQPLFNDYAPYTSYFNPDYTGEEESDGELIMNYLPTCNVWRITKTGELSFFDKNGRYVQDWNLTNYNKAVGFHWRYNEILKSWPMDEKGNLYGFKWPPENMTSSTIVRLNPVTWEQTVIAETNTYLRDFILCKDYIVVICPSGSYDTNDYQENITVIPIDNPTNSYTLEDFTFSFYDSVNDVIYGYDKNNEPKFYYSPFTSDCTVTFDTSEISEFCSIETALIRDGKTYYFIENNSSSEIKLYPVSYSLSEHKYTPELTGAITISEYDLFTDYNSRFGINQKHISSNGYVYWNYNTQKFTYVDGSTGNTKTLGDNLPDDINMIDFVLNDTDLYFTSSESDAEIWYNASASGKINIETGEYQASGLSVSINAMASVNY